MIHSIFDKTSEVVIFFVLYIKIHFVMHVLLCLHFFLDHAFQILFI